MKNTMRPFAVSLAISAVALSSVLTSWSQDFPWYVKVDAGGNLTKDTDLKDFFGLPTAGSQVKFDPGARVGLALGYNLTAWFALEAELAGMENTISSISGATSIHDATFYNVPLLFNARLQLPNPSIFTPYIGGGVGVSAAIIDVGNIFIGNTSFHGAEADAVFAYQGFAGVRCRITDQMGLSLEYRYFATDSPTWKADVVFGAPQSSNTLRFGRTQTQSLSLALDFQF
jgi:OmpA-OmpF porin, OOP family